jgi:hypothetical protein
MSERYTKKRVLCRALSDAVLWSESFIEANTADNGEVNEEGVCEAQHIERVRTLLREWFGSDRTTLEQMHASLEEECELVSVWDLAARSEGEDTQRGNEPPQNTGEQE